MAQATGTDWQNDYANFATGLKQGLKRIHDEDARRRALAEMRHILDSYAAFRKGHGKA